MCLFREAELYCVSTKMRRMSELMQFEIGISTSLYLPPNGTAGFERVKVSGERRVPAPPPKITARMFGLFGGAIFRLTFPICVLKLKDAVRIDSKLPRFKKPLSHFSYERLRRERRRCARGVTLPAFVRNVSER